MKKKGRILMSPFREIFVGTRFSEEEGGAPIFRKLQPKLGEEEGNNAKVISGPLCGEPRIFVGSTPVFVTGKEQKRVEAKLIKKYREAHPKGA